MHKADPNQHSPEDFHLVYGRGLASHVAERIGLGTVANPGHFRKIAVVLLITWVPLLLLTLLAGHAFGDVVKYPFFHDPQVHARLIFTLPLLEIGRVIVALNLNVQVRHLRNMGVVGEKDWPRFDAARARALELRSSPLAEVSLVVLAILMSLVLRIIVGISEGESSWERTGGTVTLAGWWHMLISLPILYFMLLRWVFIFLVWAWFLFRVSRFDLELTPTHPDHSGGLGFLAWGLVSFASVLMAISAVFSAGFAAKILDGHETLDSLKFRIAAFVIGAVIVLHSPLLVFSSRLARCRFNGLLEFGALVWSYDTGFEKKWINTPQQSNQESLLGSSDIQSMADIATCYDHINEMRLLPFDTKAIGVLLLAAVLPMIPLLGTQVSLQELFMKLGEFFI
jgi:hypothetical protein